MNKFLESAAIALDAIWSAKLRSFMTVLGNIVAVTSIIAVVSLIQGLNASVKQAILNQAGADSFNIEQFPVTRSDEEFDKVLAPEVSLLVFVVEQPHVMLLEMLRYAFNVGSVLACEGEHDFVLFADRAADSLSLVYGSP